MVRFRGCVPVICIALLGACAEERPAIDRVQTFALDKSFFVGERLDDPSDNPEFWSQATLVDVGYGASQESLFTSTYAQPLTRIRWEITEDLLLARLAYERIPGSDGKGVGERTDQGIIVAAFAVEKHFDIANDYNPTTGEKINVLMENDTDRPWYQRQYMRVDFSHNLNTDSYDLDTLSMLGIFDGIVYEPLSWFIDDPTHPDAPRFELTEGYFDITVKALARPQLIDLDQLGWGPGSIPACWLEYDFLGGTWPSGNCSPAELTIRHSFRRVEDLDFEPVEWDGERFQAYGAFYVERYGYERLYGMHDDNWHRFLAHYPIWQRSHFYQEPEQMAGEVLCNTAATTPAGADPHRDDDGDGTEDECEAVGGGSRCDLFRQRCTLPFREREVRPVVWYYAQESDPEYFEATELAAHQWDVALRHAVQVARYAECRRVGADGCASLYPVLTGQAPDQEDAMALALEVDDCRNGRAWGKLNRDPEGCRKLAETVGKQREASAAAVALAQLEEMLVLCHSPVLHDDPELCGPRRLPKGVGEAECEAAGEAAGAELLAECDGALRVRRGDLRYHQVNVIREPQLAMPWGIYVDSEDPLTGQKVAASINVWSAVTDEWSQAVVDQLRYSEGELTTEEVTQGAFIGPWSQAVLGAAGAGVFPAMGRQELERRLAQSLAGKELDLGALAKALAKAHPQAFKAARQVARQFRKVRAWSRAESLFAPLYAARRQAARGSVVEAALMNPLVQQLNGLGGGPISQSLMALVSPVQGGNPTVRRELRQLRREALTRRGACLLEMAQAPVDLPALAVALAEKFGAFNRDEPLPVQLERAEKMRRYIARRVHHGAIVHEMGHSIGMRHNFVSSSDAWFYRPQYWQLRTDNGAVAKQCEDLSDGADCVGPRYFDPVTKEERAGLIQMFMHSSVMEYPGETTQDFMGLGPYDFAAAASFYGDAVAVHADESYAVGTARGETVLDKTDDFGGILGFAHVFEEEDIHYSRLQELFELVSECRPVELAGFRPGRYDEAAEGKWHPVLDGMVVAAGGQYSRCRQQEVDYVNWGELRSPTGAEYSGWNGAAHTIDPLGRTRVPYGFATDDWADLGNLSVYTHDNGADAYEICNFLVTQQEVMHIFDNYRRHRQDFSLRGAQDRSLWRYNEKLRDGVKGLTLMKNFFADYALAEGMDPQAFWASVAPFWFRDNMVAAGLVFDHFTRMAARPEAGPHHRQGGDPVLRSSLDPAGDPRPPQVVVPNGVTGKFGAVQPAGRALENRYAEGLGEYNYERVVNAGSYYDKINAAMLLTESADNFISDARQDFVDPRYRAASVADLFPEGYRRFLANLLTGDDFIKGPRVAATKEGGPELDGEGFPKLGIGWTSWWGEGPTSCFPAPGTTVCAMWGEGAPEIPAQAPTQVVALDPQLGWEVQKFYIAWTLLYLPENEKQGWLDQLTIWELGLDSDPAIANRIELHAPNGKVYVARTFGKEELFGRLVQRGIGARVLEYANGLVADAFETEEGPDLDGDGVPDWLTPVINPETGLVVVRYDPAVAGVEGDWIYPEGTDYCNAEDNSGCACASNRACIELERYLSVPAFMRQVRHQYGMVDPMPDGIW